MRGYFRLHLATVVVAMLVAAVLLGLNIRGRIVDVRGTESKSSSGVTLRVPGWPSHARSIQIVHVENRDDGPYVTEAVAGEWSTQIIVLNTIVSLFVLLSATAACESILRRSLPRTVAISSD